MKHRMILLQVVMVGCLASMSLYADTPIFSGPQPSERLNPFRVLGIYGDYQQKEIDPIALADGRPTLIVFIHQLNRPTADLARVLMHYGEMYKDQRLFCAQILLDDDVTKMEQYLKGTGAWWDVGTFIGISLDGAEGPGSYGLNRNVELTVLIADKNKVTANFPLVQPSLNDAPKIARELGKLINVKVPTAQEIEFLEAPSHFLPGPPKERQHGKGTSDPKLRELICDLLRATGDEKAVQSATNRIEGYVSQDATRQSELGLASKLIIGLRYGGRAPVVDRVPDERTLLEGWIGKYSGTAP